MDGRLTCSTGAAAAASQGEREGGHAYELCRAQLVVLEQRWRQVREGGHAFEFCAGDYFLQSVGIFYGRGGGGSVLVMIKHAMCSR